MIIRNFKSSDIKSAKKLSHLVWGDFYKKENIEVQNLIYDFTVEYYDLNREFSYSIFDENDNYKGFLFAFNKKDENNSLNIFNNSVKTVKNQDNKNILLQLHEFLEYCGNKTKKNMDENDIMLGLFVSIQKGCGRMLLERLIHNCQNKNIKSLYLWSDTTCDYDYYSKNNFELLEKIKTILNNQEITVFIYRKNIESVCSA